MAVTLLATELESLVRHETWPRRIGLFNVAEPIVDRIRAGLDHSGRDS